MDGCNLLVPRLGKVCWTEEVGKGGIGRTLKGEEQTGSPLLDPPSLLIEPLMHTSVGIAQNHKHAGVVTSR